MREVALIAAVARNGIIGGDNRLLWRIKPDLRRFRDLTLGRPVVMGRKTFESIGRPLPGRMNIVLSREWQTIPEGILPVTSLADALAQVESIDPASTGVNPARIMVAGGGEIYAQTIGGATHLFITEVDLAPDGDARFPAIDRAIWQEVRRETHSKGPDDDASYAFVDYLRR